MAIIKPFRAIRPIAEKAEKVAALPYDVMSSEEAREMVKGNPYSFLHVLQLHNCFTDRHSHMHNSMRKTKQRITL